MFDWLPDRFFDLGAAIQAGHPTMPWRQGDPAAQCLVVAFRRYDDRGATALDPRDYRMEYSINQRSYRLVSVISCSGASVLAGHYTAYVRGIRTPGRSGQSNWFYVNDDNVEWAPSAHVLRPNLRPGVNEAAYMCFYALSAAPARKRPAADAAEATGEAAGDSAGAGGATTSAANSGKPPRASLAGGGSVAKKPRGDKTVTKKSYPGGPCPAGCDIPPIRKSRVYYKKHYDAVMKAQGTRSKFAKLTPAQVQAHREGIFEEFVREASQPGPSNARGDEQDEDEDDDDDEDESS